MRELPNLVESISVEGRELNPLIKANTEFEFSAFDHLTTFTEEERNERRNFKN